MALLVLAVVVFLFTVGFHKEIMATLFDRKLAEASGVNTRAVYYSVLILTGLAVPAGGGSLQPAGSLFEQAALLLMDGMVLVFMDRLKLSARSLAKQHANIE